MKLRSRIMIITFLIILFVQGLNCFLEIGFLANNLEENNLRRYHIIGNQIRRKLNISLGFGKPLVQLNFRRLLTDLIPDDIENLHVIDRTGKVIYSARQKEAEVPFAMTQTFQRVKNLNSYHIFLPIRGRTEVQGNLILVVSLKDIQEKLLVLIRRSFFNFIVILGLSLPLLYGLLTFFINRPYNRFLLDINIWLVQGSSERLRENGIDVSPLLKSEQQLKKLRASARHLNNSSALHDHVDIPGTDAEAKKIDLTQQLTRIITMN